MLQSSIKQVILPLTPMNFYYRLFHLTPRKLVRRVISKYNGIEQNTDRLQTSEHDPNSNFLGIENDIGVITVKSHSGSSRNNQNFSVDQYSKKELPKERFYCTSFGVVRNDSDNKLKYHGEYERHVDPVFPHKSTELCSVSTVSTEVLPHINFAASDEVHDVKPNSFQHNSCIEPEIKQDVNLSQTKNCQENLGEQNKGFSFIDECSFGDSYCENITNPINNHVNFNVSKESNAKNAAFIERENCHNVLSQTGLSSENLKSVVKELNFIDENYFGNATVTTKFNKEYFENSVNSVQELNFVDESYFKSAAAPKKGFCEENFENSPSKDISDDNVNAIHYSKTESGTKVDDSKFFNDKLNESIKFDKKNDSLILSQESSNCSIQDVETIKDNLLSIPKVSKTKNIKFNHAILMSDFNENSSKTQKMKEDKIILQQNTLETMIDEPNLKSFNVNKKFDNVDGYKSDYSKTVKSYSYKANLTADNKDSNVDNKSTAHDFITTLRKDDSHQHVTKGIKSSLKEKVDSKGFRILKDQVPDLSCYTRDEIISILKDNILYSDNDLLILNKPYSLVMHDSQTTKTHCLSTFLDDLAKEMDPQSSNPKLYTVHRLDKETTGCLLLARNEDMARNLKSLLFERKIIKKYWILTSGIPEELEGIIDIPIAEGSINGKKRMVLHPDIPKVIAYESQSRSGKRAVTAYKVVSTSGSAALVEVTPQTGLKHQIRVHFGFGLSCPILGDHKYSHLDKLVPQKLPADILQSLKVRQSKVRYIPMHIHARSITVPCHLTGRNLFVMAPLPNHMKINMKRLKFRKN